MKARNSERTKSILTSGLASNCHDEKKPLSLNSPEDRFKALKHESVAQAREKKGLEMTMRSPSTMRIKSWVKTGP